ncbi:hypothetical protein BKA22_001896 [Cellulomonas soli]|nr:hypothetical protein [Cellulomonas soli]
MHYGLDDRTQAALAAYAQAAHDAGLIGGAPWAEYPPAA